MVRSIAWRGTRTWCRSRSPPDSVTVQDGRADSENPMLRRTVWPGCVPAPTGKDARIAIYCVGKPTKESDGSARAGAWPGGGGRQWSDAS